MRKIFSGFILFIGLLLGISTAGYSQTAIVASPNPIPTSICNGDTILFVADNTSGTLIGFQWNFNGAAAGPQTIIGQNATFVAGTPGSYTFSLIVTDGVVLDTLNFNMIVNACNPPNIVISGTPTTVCEGTTVTFTDASTPGSVPILARSWTFSGGGSGAIPATSGSISPVVTYPNQGIYDVTFSITDANGTYDTVLVGYITVVACPAPVASFIANKTFLCPGECINFTDQSQNVVPGQSTWNWSFPGADSSGSVQQNPTNICYSIPGQYDVSLTVTNANGSDDTVAIGYIVVDSCLPPVINYSVESTKICQGTCVQFFSSTINDTLLQWTFTGADPAYAYSELSNPIVCYSDTGTFGGQIVALGEHGSDIQVIKPEINVKPFPKVVAPADTSVLSGESVELQAYGEGDNFYWTPEDGVYCQFCAKTDVAPLENTKYYVTNINENGCKATDSVNVTVIKNYYRGVPDAFSPNGDEENDILYVYGNGIDLMELYVYDRSGNIIFESRNQSDGWDGTYKGEMMEAGVYVYFVKITYNTGFQEILKGDVTLVR